MTQTTTYDMRPIRDDAISEAELTPLNDVDVRYAELKRGIADHMSEYPVHYIHIHTILRHAAVRSGGDSCKAAADFLSATGFYIDSFAKIAEFIDARDCTNRLDMCDVYVEAVRLEINEYYTSWVNRIITG